MTARRRAHSHCCVAALALAAACVSCLCAPAPVHAAQAHFAFAVVSGVMNSTAKESAAQHLIEAIGLDQRLSFVVYVGNVKGADERCADTLYERRQQLLAASAIPLVVIPGQHDWADCASAVSGGYDAAERLDFLRQTFFSDTTSLGRPALTLTRESEVARFHAFRENVRWEYGDTVFVGLDIVGGNNHYSDAGGRNGEFDDRAIASAFWLEHAAEYAKRHRAKALVVFVEADPNFKRYEEHADRFPWLRFTRHRKPDGYLEFKRSLVKAAKTFRGPVVLIHHSARAPAGGFAIDQPLYNDKGERVANLTRIAVAPRDTSTQWVLFDVDYGRRAPFDVSVRTVPKTLPTPPAAPAAPIQTPSSDVGVPGSAIEPLPGIQYVLPAPPSAPPPASAPPEPPLLSPAPSSTGRTPGAPGTPASPASPASAPAAPNGAPSPAERDSVQSRGS